MPSIRYEFDTKPSHGEAIPIADGLLWLRMPLPGSLEHINLWLLEDERGWVVVDTGLGTATTRELWKQVFDGPMGGRPVTHVVATHLHPDHVGCAGWLAQEFHTDLWMTRDEYMLCRILVADTGKPAPPEGIQFYHAAGFSAQALERYRNNFGMFGKMVSALPESYRRLADGELLHFGRHEWQVLVGRGHSPEHACLYSAQSNVVLAGDQLLPTISSNVSVWPTEPDANPLRDWLASLHDMQQRLPADVLVLPAHGKPFRGAHVRLQQIIDEHEQKLTQLHQWCAQPRRVVDTFAALYKARISADNRILATGEALAHLHFLMSEGQLIAAPDDDGVVWYHST